MKICEAPYWAGPRKKLCSVKALEMLSETNHFQMFTFIWKHLSHFRCKKAFAGNYLVWIVSKHFCLMIFSERCHKISAIYGLRFRARQCCAPRFVPWTRKDGIQTQEESSLLGNRFHVLHKILLLLKRRHSWTTCQHCQTVCRSSNHLKLCSKHVL